MTAAPVHNVAMSFGGTVPDANLEKRNLMRPQDFSRRVLLAAAGMTPQVITETLFALGCQPEPFFPTEVHIVTTASGSQRIRLELLGDETPWFAHLYRDYPLPKPRFDGDSIHVIRCAGNPVDDIRTEAENAAAADAIAGQIRAFTADDKCALHVSIAGGRKTMSYFAGSALSLYGRSQDRLSHVLVSDAFESHAQFFYPSSKQRVIYTRDNRPLNAADATVTLADIPFVRLRRWLPAELLEHSRPFSETIERARMVLEPQPMRVELSSRTVSIGPYSARAPYADLTFFLLVTGHQRKGTPLACPSEAPDEQYGREFEGIYTRVNQDTSPDSRTRKALRAGMDRAYFLQRRSRWNQFVKTHWGNAAELFQIQAAGPRGESHYQIGAGLDQVEIQDGGEDQSR